MKRAVDRAIVRAERDQALVDRHGELKVLRRAGGVVGWHAEPEVAPVERVKLNGARPAQAVIRQLEADCRKWADILLRSPLPDEYVRMKRSGQGAKWFDMVHEKCVDQAAFTMDRDPLGRLRIKHDVPRVRVAPPSAAEISWMDRMDDVLLTLGCQTYAYLLVTGRAQRVSWADLRARDVERRRERQLRNLYQAALRQLVPVWLAVIHKM
jgi:hypothetical protein